MTSAAHGSCGPYQYAGITGSSGSNTFVLNNMWAANSGTTQTLTATGPGSWSVVANSQPAGSTAVQTYPDTQQIYTRTDNTPDPLSGFGSIISSFTEKMGAASATSAEAAYDIWLGQNSSTNYADEVMIWNDQVNRGTCGGATKITTAEFGGSNSVPQQNWTLCKYGSSELIWYLTSGNEQSGTVDVLSMLTWLESHGYLPVGSGLNQIDYGFEICSDPQRADIHRQPVQHQVIVSVRLVRMRSGPEPDRRVPVDLRADIPGREHVREPRRRGRRAQLSGSRADGQPPGSGGAGAGCGSPVRSYS